MSGPAWIYEYIGRDRKQGGKLFELLRYKGKKRNKCNPNGSGRGLIPNRRDISERPKIVEKKSRKGDLEGDTVIGKGHSGALVTIVDRKSKYVFMGFVADRKSKTVTKTILSMLASADNRFHSITIDNGKEFAGHEDISESAGVEFFLPPPTILGNMVSTSTRTAQSVSICQRTQI